MQFVLWYANACDPVVHTLPQSREKRLQITKDTEVSLQGGIK